MLNVTKFNNRFEIGSLYQWDTKQELFIKGMSLAVVPEVHFAQRSRPLAIVRKATMDDDGAIRVMIPDVLLQKAMQISVYVCTNEDGNFKTCHEFSIPVMGRAKPSDYEGTNEVEVYSLDALSVELRTLEVGADATVEKVLTQDGEWTIRFGIPGNVQTVNGKSPDENGNVEIESVASWNDLTDRPFGEDDGVVVPLPTKYLPEGVPYCVESMVALLPETAVTADDGAFEIDYPIEGVAVGGTYIVKYNGVKYQCTAQGFTFEDWGRLPVLGNLGEMSGGVSTGEPFMVIVIPASGVMLISLDDATEVTFAIYGDNDIRKLDNRCLDLAWLPTVQKTDTEVLAETTSTEYASTPTLTQSILPEGTQVAVIFDGIRHECTVKTLETGTGADAMTFYYFGNLGLDEENELNTGEPFLFVSAHSTLAYGFAATDSLKHTIAVYTFNRKPNKMPAEFLPDDATVCYLSSPNGTRFAITVADDGTLSTTEVTE